MRRWGDSDDSGIVNVTDVQLALFGFQGRYNVADPPRTRAAVDVVGARVCVPDLIVSFTDVMRVLAAWRDAASYNPGVLGGSADCDVPCP